MTEVIDRLIAAADRVGMEGARLWPDVVRITFVISVFWLIATPLFGLALTAAANAIRVRLWRRLRRRMPDVSSNERLASTCRQSAMMRVPGSSRLAQACYWRP
jgi:hypothetical protein